MRRTHLAVGLAALLAASRPALAQGQLDALEVLIAPFACVGLAWLGFGGILTFGALNKARRSVGWQWVAVLLSVAATAPLWVIGLGLADEGGWVLLLLSVAAIAFVSHKATREHPRDEG